MYCELVCGVQAVIEREQAREQLENMQQRFDGSMAEMQQRIAHECDVVRREGETARQQLDVRVGLLDCLHAPCKSTDFRI